MSAHYSPKIVTDGLVCLLDAGNSKSYPGTGNVWYDLSGNNRHYTKGSGATWNSNGYFSVNTNTSSIGFTGPPSNSFGFTDIQHTIFSFIDITGNSGSTFCRWDASPNTGSDRRAISAHIPYGVDFYYDVAGCCGATQRISANNGTALLNYGIFCAILRTRTNTTPNREFFVNLTSTVNSSTNSTASVTWNDTTAAYIGSNWSGRIYNFLVYNRALTNDELAQNYNTFKTRFGL